MVVVEEQHEQKTKRHSYKDPFHVESPELNQPAPGLRWEKRLCDRDSFDVCLLQMSRYMRKADPEDGAKLYNHQYEGQLEPERKTYNVCVVSEHPSHLFLPQGAGPYGFQSVNGSKVENSNDAGQKSSRATAVEFIDQFLHAFD